MKRVYVILIALLMTGIQVSAQLADEGDSVMLSGIVVNHHTNQPYPYCQVRLVGIDSSAYETKTEADGTFATGMLPTGRYALHVRLKGIMYHHADLDLQENAFLNVAIDTVRLITLKTITIVAAKHMLGNLQITSRHDTRLWSFTDGNRDANASVAMPPDAHGNSDAGEPGGDGPVGTPLFHPAMPWRVRAAIMTGRLGSTLYSGPIWTLVPDVKHPAPADSTAKGN
ncbi:MAG: carboxypeptidase regulatory-like domain-containing protein [Bacteroidales bacterium]|nr:carboxypeptidase regulatory-like domain-containing protein [Bacteroidales bacterium]